MTEREFDAVSRLTAWLRDYGKDRSEVWRKDLEIVLRMARNAQVNEAGCTCHERDSSYACPFCRSQGILGHMEEMPALPVEAVSLFNASQGVV